MKIIKRYVPTFLTKSDKRKQIKELFLSRKLYKKDKYHSRPKLVSFKNKKSKHIENAKKIFKIKDITKLDTLSKNTGCTKKSLQKIINKGMGAYYSSGSRPNQTAHSWGIARLASSISGGKSAAVDYKILQNGCNKNSKALKLANKAKHKYGYGTRKVPKINV